MATWRTKILLNLKWKNLMPYKSKAQQAYFNANRDKLEAQGVDVDEWNKSSKGKKLPERVNKKKSSTESLIADIAAIITEEPDVFIEYDISGTGGTSTQLSSQNIKHDSLQASDINREIRDIRQQEDGDKELDKKKQEQEKLDRQEKLQKQKLLKPQYDTITKSVDNLRGAVDKSTGQFDTGMDTVNTMNTSLDGLDKALQQFNKLALQ